MTTALDAQSLILPDPSVWRITYGEIATLARVRRPVPTTWSRRHADFPRPVAREDGRPFFDAREVVAWLTATGHGNAAPRQLKAELALHTLSAWRSHGLPAPVLVGALTALVCLRQQLDAPVSGQTWDALMERAMELDSEDTFLLAELRAVPDPGHAGLALAALADELTESAFTPAEAFDWIVDARRRLGSHELAADEPTSAVVRTLAALSGVDVLDDGAVIATPYARAGDLLAALHSAALEDSGHTYLAADPDRDRVRLVRRRMLVRGVYEFHLDVAEGEELTADDWGYPNVLACVLPYEAAETRSPSAVLRRVEGLADYLDTGSTAVVLGPADALVQGLSAHSAADRLRRGFLRDGLLKAAISLPDGVFPYRPGYRTAVWVLSRTPEDKRAGLVFLADLSSRPLTEAVLDGLAEDVAMWRASDWRGDRRHEPRNAVIVPAKSLDDRPGTPFLPQHRPAEARYTRRVVERPVRLSELGQKLTALQDRSRHQTDLRTAVGALAVLRPESETVKRTSVRRLMKQGRLRKRPGHRFAAEHLTVDGHYRVITPDEIIGAVRPGAVRIDRGVLLTGYGHAQFTEPGDVVVTTSPQFGVYVDEEGLSVVAAPARILRVRPDADPPLQPRVLAALLRAVGGEHARTPGAVRASRAIEDLVIPDLGREEGERFDAWLAEVERRAALLREQSTALDDLARITAEGMADGTLAIQKLLELPEPPSSIND